MIRLPVASAVWVGLLFAVSMADGAAVHVALSGNDGADGSPDRPLRDPEKYDFGPRAR